MIILEFENNLAIDNDFPNNKPNAPTGARWYTRSQECLIFKHGSKYPDKFELNLVFSSEQNDQKSQSTFSIGKYMLLDSAFGFDNRRNPVVDFTQIQPLNDAVIDSQVKQLLTLKKSL